jgi:hypothetical protein
VQNQSIRIAIVSVLRDFASVLPDRIFVQTVAVLKTKFKSSVACGMHPRPEGPELEHD